MLSTAFFLALGSNLQPYENVPRMIDSLLTISPVVDVSPILITAPVGMPDSHNTFLNLVVRIHVNRPASELKLYLSSEEVRLGRDRSDPLSKMKDRVADMDILFALEQGVTAVPPAEIPTESYVRPQLLSLLAHLSLTYPPSGQVEIDCADLSTATLPFHGQTIGPVSVSLYQDINSRRLFFW